MSSPWPPPPPPPPNILSPPRHHHNRHVVTTEVIPPIAGATVTLSLLTLLVFIYRRLKRSVTSACTSSAALTYPRRFSYSTLRRATNSFHISRRLGQGGFGAVFSATVSVVDDDGRKTSKRQVAVKLMDSGSLQGEREFHNEIMLAEKLVDSDRVVKLLGFASSRRRRRMCLVYELMPNGNLQDCLLHKKSEELTEWSARIQIAVDVAKGLAFLHHQCAPPIIHGDVKPSNVLLDDNFVAKLADFGLARLKLVDNFSRENNVNNNEHEVVINVNDNGNVVGGGMEDSGSVLETESVTTTVGFEEGSVIVDQSPVRVQLAVETSPEMVTATASPSELFDKGSDLEGQGEGGKEVVKNGDEGGNGNGNGRGLGKEWWRKRDNGGGRGGGGGGSEQGKVKEYVMEWMGLEVAKERPENDWRVGVGGASSSYYEPKKVEKKGKKKLEWWMSMDDERESKKVKSRPVREWWKDEYSEALAKKKKKKNKKKKKHQGSKSDHEDNWWPRDEETYLDKNKTKSRSRSSSRSSVDWWLDGLSGDLWKLRNTSYDSVSGEIPKSGGITSTPSMRGTVCYIAPEYSMGGDLSEKCDVYSFGVLLLVLISGRRPLQVTGSPLSEFHKANLLSWARQLARSGKLLDLVDSKIRSLNRVHAQQCIIIALSCVQKSPARRPSMKEVAGMLTGELPPPELPMEYSPSPASKYPHKSRRKLR